MKILLLVAFVLFGHNCFSQVYKVITVGNTPYVSLVHLKAIEEKEKVPVDSFSLLTSNHSSDIDVPPYEIQYFKGNVGDMYSFLDKVLQFTEKYKKENAIQTTIAGVQVRTLITKLYSAVQIFDKERKNYTILTLKQLTSIRDSFVEYQKQ